MPLNLDISFNELGSRVDIFAEIVKKILPSRVRGLDVAVNQLSNISKEQLDEALAQTEDINTFLQEIDLSGNELGKGAPDFLLSVYNFIAKFQAVKELDLDNNFLGENENLFVFLWRLHELNLTYLGLTENHLGDIDILDQNLEVFVLHPTLERLNLAANGLSVWEKECLSSFFALVLHKDIKLKQLDLEANWFSILLEGDSERKFINIFCDFLLGAMKKGLIVDYKTYNFDDISEIEQKLVPQRTAQGAFFKTELAQIQTEIHNEAGSSPEQQI